MTKERNLTYEVPEEQVDIVSNAVEKVIEELLTAEQQRKDQLAREHNHKQTGGGVVELTPSSKDLVYDSVRDGINDLYNKQLRGDTSSKKILDQLWGKITGKQLRKFTDEGFSISGCPKCGYPMSGSEDNCSNCGFDFSDYHRYRVW